MMPFVIAFAVLLIAAFLQLIASVFLLALAYGRDYGRGEGDCRQLYIFFNVFWCVETQEYLCFFLPFVRPAFPAAVPCYSLARTLNGFQ